MDVNHQSPGGAHYEGEQYLRKGVTRETLATETKRMTHFESAQKVFVERQKLFREINSKL